MASADVSPNEHIVTQGDTLEELKAMIVDAIDCHFFDDLPVVTFEVESNQVQSWKQPSF